jgi:hypothetical protein
MTLVGTGTTTASDPVISQVVPDGCPSNWATTGTNNSINGDTCSYVRAGNNVNVYGSNFNSNSQIVIDNGYYSSVNGAVNTTFVTSAFLSFVVPQNIAGGTHLIQVKQTDNSFLSNAVILAVNANAVTPISAVPLSVSLMTASSTASQTAPVGSNGASNLTKATYNFLSNGSGALTINELKFSVNAPNTVTLISVNGISTAVVNGVADLTGLNVYVPNGGSANLDAYLSYPGVGVNGIASGSTSSITLTYVKYISNGTTSTITPNISSPTMTLISAN